MPSRYYTQDARLTGPLEFLAGFGQKRQEIKTQETQMDFQNEMAGRQMLMGAATRTANDLVARGTQGRQFDQRTQEQRLSGSQRIGEQNNAAFIERYGEPPSPFAPAPQQGGATVGQPGLPPGAAGPPAPQQQEQPGGMVPPAFNPAATADYKASKRRFDELSLTGNRIRRGYGPNNERLSTEEVTQQLAALAPEVAQVRQSMARTQPPDNRPRMADGTVMRPGMNRGSDGSTVMLEPDGSQRYYAPTKASESGTKRWMGIADPEERAAAKESDLDSHHVGPRDPDAEYMHDGIKWTKQKKEKDFDFGEYVSKRAAEIPRDADGPIGIERAVQEARVIEKEIAVQKAEQKAVKENADLREQYGEIYSSDQFYQAMSQDDPKFMDAVMMFLDPERNGYLEGQARKDAYDYIIQKLDRMIKVGALNDTLLEKLDPLRKAMSRRLKPLPITLQP